MPFLPFFAIPAIFCHFCIFLRTAARIAGMPLCHSCHFLPFLPFFAIPTIFLPFLPLPEHTWIQCSYVLEHVGPASLREQRTSNLTLESRLAAWNVHTYSTCTLCKHSTHTAYIKCGRHRERDTRYCLGFLETPSPRIAPLPSNHISPTQTSHLKPHPRITARRLERAYVRCLYTMQTLYTHRVHQMWHA